MVKAISDGDRYFQQVALKPLQHFDNETLPKFVHNPNYYTLTRSSRRRICRQDHRHFDHINCLLTRDEFVVTQAVRGLGKAVIEEVERFYTTCKNSGEEAKNYSHVR